MKITGFGVLCCCAVFWTTGCGGGNSGSSNPIMQPTITGSWTLISGSPGSQVTWDAYLTQNGAVVNGPGMQVTGSATVSPVTVTGTLSESTVSLQFTESSQIVMQFTATLGPVSNGQFTNFSGTTSTGQPVTGQVVPSMAGNWQGQISVGTFTVALTQQGFDQFGFPHISGTVTFSGISCVPNGIMDFDQRGNALGSSKGFQPFSGDPNSNPVISITDTSWFILYGQGEVLPTIDSADLTIHGNWGESGLPCFGAPPAFPTSGQFMMSRVQ